MNLSWVNKMSNNTRGAGIHPPKGAGAFHSAGQSKEGSVGFGTSQHPIFTKLALNMSRKLLLDP